jgi:DNA repair protein SbcC/Rad50
LAAPPTARQRFELALKAAYGPVAAHLDAQRAARQQNLLARDQLVDALNALALPDSPDSPDAAAGDTSTADVASTAGIASTDWKALANALDRFHTEWRKLGPLEHTVPHQERDKLLERTGAAVARLEAPLNNARRGAELARERLLSRARALAAEAAAGAPGPPSRAPVRELQAEWQHHAASLPLARATESALWARFKADLDAVFAARDAAASAREAEFKAHGAERAALIERLMAIPADAAAAELKRCLAEVDVQWQRAGPAPRSDAAALDARFPNARETVRQQLASHAQRSWQATCDALVAKLALCEALEQETSSAQTRATLPARWAELAVLPTAWEQALAQRASLAGVATNGGVSVSASTDELLLQLEAAFELESPPAVQAARRALKLQAMKAALEGRAASAAAPLLKPDQWLAAALARPALDGEQRERLGRVIAALRERAS